MGYLSFNGNLDSAIAIRSAFIADDRIFIQAGAGIVADSDPEREFVEAENKLKAVKKADRGMQPEGDSMRILLLDNYDSFVYNLKQHLGELGPQITVVRNDAIDVAGHKAVRPGRHHDIARARASGGSKRDFGVCAEALTDICPAVPTLGVCLGHQGIAHYYGGKVMRAAELMHGKTSVIEHDGEGVFAGLEDSLTVGRYHSLVVGQELPDDTEGDRPHRGRHHNGHQTQQVSDRGGPVPPGIDPHAQGEEHVGQFHRRGEVLIMIESVVRTDLSRASISELADDMVCGRASHEEMMTTLSSIVGQG